MIPFQFRMFLKTILTSGRMDQNSVQRVATRVVIGLTFLLYALSTAVFLALDHVFFPGFRKQKVDRPVFVIGNPRSGTSFLHRVLAKDDVNFTTTRMWQLAFPALTQQILLKAFGAVDRAISRPFSRLLEKVQDKFLSGADKVHKLRFDMPEEDEAFFILPWASGFLFNVFPRPEWMKYQKMDEMPEAQRKPLMTFYRECIKRHLYQDPLGRGLLSKNPLFPAKIQSVYDFFPGARIVYIVRNPAEMIASVHNLLFHLWKTQGIHKRPNLLEWSRYCYEHALEVLDRAPEDSYVIVKYDELVADPRGTVERLYETLEIPMSPQYRAALIQEEANARKYKSEHIYSLERFDLTHEEIEALVPYVYDRFGFPRQGKDHKAG